MSDVDGREVLFGGGLGAGRGFSKIGREESFENRFRPS
jgi:hypothetical protein